MFTPQWPSGDANDNDDNGNDDDDATSNVIINDNNTAAAAAAKEEETNGSSDIVMNGDATDSSSSNNNSSSSNLSLGHIIAGNHSSISNNSDSDTEMTPLESYSTNNTNTATNSNDDTDGIELTHCPITGITSVTDGAATTSTSANDVVVGSSWTATFPNHDDDAAAMTNNNNVTTMEEEEVTQMDEQDWQMKNFNDNDPSHIMDDNNNDEDATKGNDDNNGGGYSYSNNNYSNNNDNYNNASNLLTSFATGGGDIWSTEAFSHYDSSPLKDLLDSQSYSLVDLLGQDELLQELRGCHGTLVEYFGRREVVAGLVECLVCEVPGREGWVRGEVERRERRRMRNSSRNLPDDDDDNGDDIIGHASLPKSPMRCAPTVEVNTHEEDTDISAIEAYWNSPTNNNQRKNKGSPGAWMFGGDRSPDNHESEDTQQQQQQQEKEEEEKEEERTPEEEYDLRYVRYPYMACEVLCSEVGPTIDVLVDGYVDDIMIDDEEDSLLGDGGSTTMKRNNDMLYDDIHVHVDDSNRNDTVPPHLRAIQDAIGTSPLMTMQQQELEEKETTPKQQPLPQKRILDLLFSVLIDTPPASLDDRRAGYFEKVLVVLFRKRSQSMSEYMNTPLIVTSGSIGMAQHMLADNSGEEEDFDKKQLPILPSSDSPPHSPSAHLNPFPSSPYTTNTTTASSDLPPSPLAKKILSPNTPPMLMCAFFDHLHSHSIMHIVQRLLLPSPARQQQNSKEDEDKVGTGTLDSAIGESSDVDNNPTNAMNDEFMNTINQINGLDIQNQLNADEDEMDEDDLENAMNHLFRCDWSERPGHALELLLAKLEGRTEPFLIKYGFPVGYDVSQLLSNNNSNNEGEQDTKDEREEAALSCSQHASEILITIIQNSMLDSAVMISLSSEPVLTCILNVASSSMDEEPVFVPYESTMTCAMTVLESLVLQLGGYGAVATISAVGGGDMTAMETLGAISNHSKPLSPPSTRSMDTSISLTELGPHTPPVFSPQPPSPPTTATTSTLIKHLPTLLAELSSLLTHPVTKTWTTPAQYTHCQPRPLLGTSRLRIIRLIESLVLLGDRAVDIALQQSDCLEHCLTLFWEFEWCSMLHQSAANLLVHVFEGGDGRSGLQEYFIVRCRLLERLIDSFGNEVRPDSGDKGDGVGSSIDNDASSKLKELLGVAGSDEENGEVVKEGETSPVYGGMMLAMKDMYQTEHPTSSLESQCDSESDNSNDDRFAEDDENAAIVPVSDDDVDSAMEKESQDNEAMLGISIEDEKADPSAVSDVDEDENPSLPQDEGESPSQPQEPGVLSSSAPSAIQGGYTSGSWGQGISFRKGYMGHVIIICQALVHACNNSQCGNTPGVEGKGSHPGSPGSIGDFASTSDFDSSAVNSASDEMCLISNKRKDRSPTRSGDEDVKRIASSPPRDEFFCPASPISKAPSSPNEVENIVQSPMDGQSIVNQRKTLRIDSILRMHPLYDKWQTFISSVLASEMSVQSSPLGGQQMAKDSSASVGSDPQGHMLTIVEDNSDNDFLGAPTDRGVFSGLAGGIIVGELAMDDDDVDIAGDMIKALDDISGFGLDDGNSSRPVGHSRRNRGVIGGGALLGASGQDPFGLQDDGSERGSGIANFGSVILRPTAKEYLYDDPLGGGQAFETGDSSDEDETNTNGTHASDDDVFMSDAMVISKDKDGTKQSEEKMNRSQSIDSADDDDDDVQVMNLFAGNFSFEDNACAVDSTEKDASNDDGAWANFANFDGAFEPTPIGPPDDSNPFDSGDTASQYPDNYFSPVRHGNSNNTNPKDAFALSEPPFNVAENRLDNGTDEGKKTLAPQENGVTVPSAESQE